MLVYALKSELVRPGDLILQSLSRALTKSQVHLRNHDIVAMSSKIVAISQQRVRDVASVKASSEATRLARKFALAPAFAQVVLDESDLVIGGVRGALLTIKNGDAVANAGVDRKNAPKDSVVLWPSAPDTAARRLRIQIKRRFGKDVGVVVVDSRVSPLRLGTTGFAIGSAGFKPVIDLRGAPDLSGRRMQITFQAVADGLAAVAQLVMGETSDRRPFVVIRGAPSIFGDRSGIGKAKLKLKSCLYMSQIPVSRKEAY